MTSAKSFWIAIHMLYNVDVLKNKFGKTHKTLNQRAVFVAVPYLQIYDNVSDSDFATMITRVENGGVAKILA